MASNTNHSITSDHIINNSEEVKEDYKIANKRGDKAVDGRDHDRIEGALLFRLLIPGPANIRGRTEAYKMSQGGKR